MSIYVILFRTRKLGIYFSIYHRPLGDQDIDSFVFLQQISGMLQCYLDTFSTPFQPLSSTNARKSVPPPEILYCSKRSGSNSSLHWGLVFYAIQPNSCFFRLLLSTHYSFRGNLKSLNMAINIQEVEVDQTSASASEASEAYIYLHMFKQNPGPDISLLLQKLHIRPTLIQICVFLSEEDQSSTPRHWSSGPSRKDHSYQFQPQQKSRPTLL